MRIALLEDDMEVGSAINQWLENAGHHCHHFTSGKAIVREAARESYDLFLLDWNIPDLSGLDVLKWLRDKQISNVPVIFITSRDTEADIVGALAAGADDYMIKPFELPELLARLRALLRRSQAATSAILSFGPIELDTANRRASANRDGQSVSFELGPREWTVMEYLLIHAPKPASKDKLLQALTGWDKEITPNAVEVYISRLRGKLEPHGIALRSIRGFGYRLEHLSDRADEPTA